MIFIGVVRVLMMGRAGSEPPSRRSFSRTSFVLGQVHAEVESNL